MPEPPEASLPGSESKAFSFFVWANCPVQAEVFGVQNRFFEKEFRLIPPIAWLV
jgi:hypothetical protein